MLLRVDHFAVFQANWNDKATNIKAIAEELSLGLDAMVFLDDNPVERGLVRQILPQVAVPELPDDPRLRPYAGRRRLFRGCRFSAEDRERAETTRPTPAAWRCRARPGTRSLSGLARHGDHLRAVRRDRPRAIASSSTSPTSST